MFYHNLQFEKKIIFFNIPLLIECSISISDSCPPFSLTPCLLEEETIFCVFIFFPSFPSYIATDLSFSRLLSFLSFDIFYRK